MRRILAATAVLFLMTAACGDDDGANTASGSGSGSAADAGDAPVELEGTVNNHGTGEASDSEAFELELDNFYFAPTFTKAAKGSTIEVELTNEGDVPHTFTIDSLGIDEEVEPGDSTTVTVEVPDEDTALEYYCRFHESQGMKGALYTADGATVAAGSGAESTTTSAPELSY